MRRGVVMSIALATCLSGCASQGRRSEFRWISLENGSGPQAKWAQCVDQRSRAYLSSDTPAPAPPWAPIGSKATFSWVLADCADKMVGPEWENLTVNQFERLLGDAHRHFNGWLAIEAIQREESANSEYDIETI